MWQEKMSRSIIRQQVQELQGVQLLGRHKQSLCERKDNVFTSSTIHSVVCRSRKQLLPLSAARRMVLSFPVVLILPHTSGKSFCHHRDWRESSMRNELAASEDKKKIKIKSPRISNLSKYFHLFDFGQ